MIRSFPIFLAFGVYIITSGCEQDSIPVENEKSEIYNLLVEAGLARSEDLSDFLESVEATKEFLVLSNHHEYDEKEGTSTTTISIIPQDKNTQNISIYEYIPKEVAASAKELEFFPDPTEIIHDDPLVMWHFSSVDERIDISYKGQKKRTKKSITIAYPEEGFYLDGRNGIVYRTVEIGSQIWMASNLKYMPEVSPALEMSDFDPHYYVYGYNGTSITQATKTHNIHYGVLYNWEAAQSACPKGWRLPSESDWQELESTIGMTSSIILADEWRGSSGGKLKNSSYSYWEAPNSGATNEYLFNALPSGYTIHGEFQQLGEFTGFWSSTQTTSTAAYYRALSYDESGIRRADYKRKKAGYSVRCIKE